MPTLSKIYIYPIKSLSGFQVDRWSLNKKGLEFDRQWMLIDQEGQFLSQRTLPVMALIQTAIEENDLVITAAGMPSLRVPLKQTSSIHQRVRIWDDFCEAEWVSDEADHWFSDYLKTPCHLVYFPDNAVRKVDPNYALETDQTAFSDGFPILLASEASLQSINAQTGLKLTMERFRPNLVVEDCPAFAEDLWRTVQIGNINFRFPKPCSRCTIPGIDPKTATMDKITLQELARLRRWNQKVYFGQNVLHDSEGSLQVGMAVDVIHSGLPQPPIS